jgi:hypothetical protein
MWRTGFHMCRWTVYFTNVRATGCPNFGMLAYQRGRLSHLGVPGELMRYSAGCPKAMQWRGLVAMVLPRLIPAMPLAATGYCRPR